MNLSFKNNPTTTSRKNNIFRNHNLVIPGEVIHVGNDCQYLWTSPRAIARHYDVLTEVYTEHQQN